MSAVAQRASLAALAGAALVAACGSDGAPGGGYQRTARITSAIQDGTIDTTHDFVVAVPVEQADGQIALCSGALLAPNLVVTARHCVSQLASDTIDCATSTFGSTLSAANVRVTNAATIGQHAYQAVSQVIVPTGPGSASVCGNDIALLILQKAIASSGWVTPALSPPITDHSTYSTEVTAIGYGVTSAGDTTGVTAGTRRIVKNVAIGCIPGDTTRADCFAAGSGWQGVITAGEFVSGDESTCQGDSGSAAFDQAQFDQGKWVALGILSRGGVNDEATMCVDPIYTRLDAWGSLIADAARQAAAAGGYAVPQWAGGTNSFQSFIADGSACAADAQCSSGNCVSTDNKNFVCASPCSSSCPGQFACVGGFCFPTTSTVSAQDSPPPSSGGCSVAPRPAPGTPAVELGALALTGAATVAFARRRRARRASPRGRA
jgi:MYXO-CTERM domain-containing protein